MDIRRMGPFSCLGVFLWGMVFCGWLAVPHAGATTYYVSLTGLDTYNGQSPTWSSGQNGPFRTIQKAVNTSVGGDAIEIRGGSYTESVNITKTCSQALPLTIRNYGSEVVSISPGAFAPLWISSSTWLRIGGLRLSQIVAAGLNAIYIGNSTSIAVTNCDINSNQAASAIYAVNSYDVQVAGNRFKDNNVWPVQINNCVASLVASNRIERTRTASTLVLMGSNSRSNAVLANTFVDNYLLPGTNICVIFVYQVGAGNTIQSNVIYNSSLPSTAVSGDGSAAIRVSETDDIVVRGNLVSNYQFKGTVDFTADNGSYLITPAQGGRSGAGIAINGTLSGIRERIVVESNTVIGAGNTGIELDYVNNSTLRGNTVIASGQYGLHVHGDQNNHSVVTGNVIEANTSASNGWLNGGMSGISVTHVGTGNIIRRNICFGNRQGTAGAPGTGWYNDGMGIIADLNSDGTWIMNNLCFGNEGCGIGVVKSDDCIVLNNTIVGNGRCVQNLDNPGAVLSPDNGQGWTVSNTRFENNIIYNNRKRQMEVFDVTGQTFTHNLFLSGPLTDPVYNDLVFWWDLGLSPAQQSMDFAEWKAYWAGLGSGNSAGDLNVNPSFAGGAVSAANMYGYKPAKGSPVINAGVNDSRLTGTLDPAGNDRLSHGVADIGALEYVTSGNTLFPVTFTGSWVNVTLWDNTGAFWWAFNGSGTQWAPSQITVPAILPNRWYWVGVWDYASSSWGYGNWFARFE